MPGEELCGVPAEEHLVWSRKRTCPLWGLDLTVGATITGWRGDRTESNRVEESRGTGRRAVGRLFDRGLFLEGGGHG